MKLEFPTDRIVGRLDWVGAWEAGGGGPVLATGGITVPDDVDITLEVVALRGRERSSGGGWQLLHDNAYPQVDLEFLRDLPSAAISRLSLRGIAPETFAAVTHLQPGLVALYLVLSEFGDEVLPHVAALSNLNYLQTFGNRFTDAGVQQLVALQSLQDLYLEEETLTHAAFAFTSELPHLERLGLQDVPHYRRRAARPPPSTAARARGMTERDVRQADSRRSKRLDRLDPQLDPNRLRHLLDVGLV